MSLLPLPIAPAAALDRIIEPTLALLPPALASDPARVLLLAIALQESDLACRDQHDAANALGPALGLWQFERRGGVMGVLGGHATARMAATLCAVRGVPATSYSVFTSLPGDDLLACGFARLLLYADPAPLPVLGEAEAGWAYYMRTWKPGKPRPATWSRHYATALACVREKAHARL